MVNYIFFETMNADFNSVVETSLPLFSRSGRERLRKVRLTVGKSRNAISREFGGGAGEHRHLTRLALNEAEAIAWQSGFPHLVFPSLAEEKVRAVANWSRRQRLLRGRSPSIRGFSA